MTHNQFKNELIKDYPVLYDYIFGDRDPVKFLHFLRNIGMTDESTYRQVLTHIKNNEHLHEWWML